MRLDLPTNSLKDAITFWVELRDQKARRLDVIGDHSNNLLILYLDDLRDEIDDLQGAEETDDDEETDDEEAELMGPFIIYSPGVTQTCGGDESYAVLVPWVLLDKEHPAYVKEMAMWIAGMGGMHHLYEDEGVDCPALFANDYCMFIYDHSASA